MGKSPESMIDVQAVFAGLERWRSDGSLAARVCPPGTRYRASKRVVGYVERVGDDGVVAVGRFVDGKFCAADEGELAGRRSTT